MADDMMRIDDQSRFHQLLPFYVTGQLSLEDKLFVEDYIAAHPDAKKAVSFTQKLSKIVRSTGANRNPDQALNRLLADFQPRKKLSLVKRLLAKLRSLGISPPLAIALLVIVGQGVGYTAHQLNWFSSSTEVSALHATPHVSLTIKDGADLAATTSIIEKFGGQIVNSPAVVNAEKIFVSIMDKTKIPALIDTLMDAGLIESALILM
ncbi:MAG: hypothetical protein ACKOD7_06990 [Polynucleobacter victoriensis]